MTQIDKIIKKLLGFFEKLILSLKNEFLRKYAVVLTQESKWGEKMFFFFGKINTWLVKTGKNNFKGFFELVQILNCKLQITLDPFHSGFDILQKKNIVSFLDLHKLSGRATLDKKLNN